MTIKIHDLKPAPGAKREKTRVGRGEGSKGKTAGRGTKGTKARKNVPAGFEGTPYDQLRWVTSADRAAMERFSRVNLGDVALDHDEEMVAFFTSDWRRRRAEEEWPMLRFHALREQHGFEAA